MGELRAAGGGGAGPDTPKAGALTGSVLVDPRYQLALRVAESRHFHKAPRLKEFLLYVCEQTLLGQTEKLTEQQIGPKIFDRRPDYSPADDSIVRVQARQLRLRLAEYFNSEGRDEQTVIEIPRGSYVALFRKPGEIEEPAKDVIAAPPQAKNVLAFRVIAGVVIAALATSCLLLLLENRQLRLVTRAPGGPLPRGTLMLDALFDRDRVTDVIVGDSGFGLIQGIVGGTLTLDDYLRPGYPASVLQNLSPAEARWARAVTERPYVVFNRLMMVEQLAKLSLSRGWRYSIRFGRDVQTRELSEGSHILIGGRMSNPWMTLYEGNLVFRSEWNAAGDVGRFRNTAPQRGEQELYTGGGRNGVPGQAFAAIALMPNPNDPTHKGRILMLRGTNMEAAEAAWDYVVQPIQQAQLARQLGAMAEGKDDTRTVEVLLETRALAGSHDQVTVKSVRVH